jgi:hypothetical protein
MGEGEKEGREGEGRGREGKGEEGREGEGRGAGYLFYDFLMPCLGIETSGRGLREEPTGKYLKGDGGKL